MTVDLIWTANGWQSTGAAASSSTLMYRKSGVLSVAVGTSKFRFPFDATIKGVSLACDTAPTGADVIADVNVNGTTIFTTQANRPRIIAGSTFAAEVTSMDVSTVAAGAYATVDIDQIGSTTPGIELTALIRFTKN